jgi:hypothetical protein
VLLLNNRLQIWSGFIVVSLCLALLLRCVGIHLANVYILSKASVWRKSDFFIQANRSIDAFRLVEENEDSRVMCRGARIVQSSETFSCEEISS